MSRATLGCAAGLASVRRTAPLFPVVSQGARDARMVRPRGLALFVRGQVFSRAVVARHVYTAGFPFAPRAPRAERRRRPRSTCSGASPFCEGCLCSGVPHAAARRRPLLGLETRLRKRANLCTVDSRRRTLLRLRADGGHVTGDWGRLRRRFPRSDRRMRAGPPSVYGGPMPDEELTAGLTNRHARRALEAMVRKKKRPQKRVKPAPSCPPQIKMVLR